jgi:thioredoxin-dependent peroxiredoxin
MPKTVIVVVFILILGGLAAVLLLAQKTHLKPGDMAPDFTLKATTGQSVTLSDFRGQQTVVLAFFPKAFTGGCTREMKGYQAGISEFETAGARVFGISTDNVGTLKRFSTELKTSFAMLSDADHKVSAQYGVLTGVGFANRTTFVVGKDGRILHIEEGSAAIEHAGAVLACQRVQKK